jgi:hypothetical protein
MMPQTPEADTLTLSSRVFNRNMNCLSVPGSFKFFAVVRVAHLCCFLFCGFVLKIVVCHFFLFVLVIVLSVFLQFTASDCPIGSFKLFLEKSEDVIKNEQSRDTGNIEHKTGRDDKQK